MANISKSKALDVGTKFEIIKACKETNLSKVKLKASLANVNWQ
jgi:hypothetical protein